MNTFFTRTLFGAIYAIIVVGSILLGPLSFGIVIFIFLLLSLREYLNFMNKADVQLSSYWFCVSNILIYSFAFLAAYLSWPAKTYFLLFIVIYLPFFFQVLSRNTNPFQVTGHYLVSHFYLSVPLGLLNFLFKFGSEADYTVNYIVLSFFLMIWINDSLAYITGSLFGKHKLDKVVSPNKTWEGSIGGLVFTLIGAYFLHLIFPGHLLLQWLGLGLIIVIFGTFGDLFESVAKRGILIKESGSLLPGHGGILDRLDSLLIASPFVFMYFLLLMK